LTFYDIGGNSLNLVLTIAKLGEAKFNITTEDFLRSQNMKELFEKCMKSRNVYANLALEPRATMKIEPINDQDMEKCANLLAKCYTEKNSLMKLIADLKSENIYHFLEANWKFFVERDLSFKVVEKNEEILGVSLNYERKDESELKKSEIEVMEPIREFLELTEDNFM
jgi:hypothetical protein